MLDYQSHPLRERQGQRSYSYLGGYVVWGPAESAGRGPRENVLLAHAEVSDFDVSFRVQHHVVQFQVPGGRGGVDRNRRRAAAVSSNPFPSRGLIPPVKGLGLLTGR